MAKMCSDCGAVQRGQYSAICEVCASPEIIEGTESEIEGIQKGRIDPAVETLAEFIDLGVLDGVEEKYYKMIANTLRDGENIIIASQGMVRDRVLDKDDAITDGVLLVTSQRAIRMAKFWLQESVAGIPLEKISAVNTRKGMVGLVTIEVTTSNEDFEFTTNKTIAPSLVQALEDGRMSLTKNSGQGGGEVSVLDQIERLGQLHSSGVLSDEEFAQQKAKLLKRL